MSKKIDLVGKRYYRWTVLGFESRKGRSYWKCRCDCGTENFVYGLSLTKGLSQSCGCWRVEVGIANGRATKGGRGNGGTSRTHGEAVLRTPEYRTWVSMHERCRSPNSVKWDNYGGRGIRVCERWQSFENFLADMGRRPSATLSLDRVNNDGNYEPDNCRWATKKEQVDNRRKFGRVEKFLTSELLNELSRRNALVDVAGLMSLPT